LKRPYINAVIGKNFGDEGKGLVVDYLALQAHEKPVLVIRHNGGAQSGHTVDLPDKRFVFHELSSGSFRRADTFWADTFYPDMYKLGEEAEDFRIISGFVPRIFAHPQAQITLIEDVLLNMAAEEARGVNRHGSCGMGIYEAQCRNEAGFEITMQELFSMEVAELVKRMSEIREEYLPGRMEALGLSWENLGEYGELLQNDEVLQNAAVEMLRNRTYVQLAEDVKALLMSYDRVIFETGQGLLLDENNERFAPHVTASPTGLQNPCAFLNRYDMELDEVVYVTRSYVTRHGAGPLPYECSAKELGIWRPDRTNEENLWQGSLRFAPHGSLEEFAESVRADLKIAEGYHQLPPYRSLLVTHLNETEGCLYTTEGKIPFEQFAKNEIIGSIFNRFYASSTYYAADI